MFQRFLNQSNTALDIQFFWAVDRHLPCAPDVCDAYICSGSRSGVNDDEVWIKELEIFVRDLYKARKGLIGICFGHQMIAKALGGTVSRSEKGWGLGVATSNVMTMTEWMQPPLSSVNLVVSHQDQVTELPESSKVILSSDFCPNSMVQIGDHFLGLQGHPEFSKDYSSALISDRITSLDNALYASSTKSLQMEVDDLKVLSWMVRFLESTL